MISKIHIIIQKIRHAPGFRRLKLVWSSFRPIYFWLLTLFTAKRGLLVTIGGFPIRIHPTLAAADWANIECESYRAFSAEIKPGDIFYDIGAHMGTYTVIALRYSGPRGKAVCYEPHDCSFNMLKKVLTWNNCESRAVLRNIACGAIVGTADFYYRSDKADGINSILPIEGFEKRTINLTTIDAEVEKLGLIPSVIKIDVEGSEWEVLRGAESVLKLYNPCLFLSLHESRLSSIGVTPEMIMNWLIQKNYEYRVIGCDYEIHVFAKTHSKMT